jgi:glutamate-1-semialdehyde 2,1-aminomutase
MKAVSRYFATQGIIIPSATSASLSTPMTPAEMDHVADVFDRFLETQSANYETLL